MGKQISTRPCTARVHLEDMRITNILLHSSTHLEVVKPKGQIFHIFGGNILYLLPNYQKICLTKRETFNRIFSQSFNINKEVQKAVSNILHIHAPSFNFIVYNVHTHVTLPFYNRSLIDFLVNEIQTKFEVKQVEITQEQNCPHRTTFERLYSIESNFLNIGLKLFGIAGRFQNSKISKSTQATFIFTQFFSDTFDFFYFLSGMAILCTDVKQLFQNIKKTVQENPSLANVLPQNVAIELLPLIQQTHLVTIQDTKILRQTSKAGGEEFVKRFAEKLFNCSVEWETVESLNPAADTIRHTVETSTYTIWVQNNGINIEDACNSLKTTGMYALFLFMISGSCQKKKYIYRIL